MKTAIDNGEILHAKPGVAGLTGSFKLPSAGKKAAAKPAPVRKTPKKAATKKVVPATKGPKKSADPAKAPRTMKLAVKKPRAAKKMAAAKPKNDESDEKENSAGSEEEQEAAVASPAPASKKAPAKRGLVKKALQEVNQVEEDSGETVIKKSRKGAEVAKKPAEIIADEDAGSPVVVKKRKAAPEVVENIEEHSDASGDEMAEEASPPKSRRASQSPTKMRRASQSPTKKPEDIAAKAGPRGRPAKTSPKKLKTKTAALAKEQDDYDEAGGEAAFEALMDHKSEKPKKQRRFTNAEKP